MAVRLAVVMIESAPPTAAAGQFAADVVGNLIGRPGLDLVLVSSLAAGQISETDHLSLEAISGDLAVLDWQRPESMLDSLTAVGLNGSRCPHDHDPCELDKIAGGRRIYAFDLDLFRAATELVAALEKLNRDRQTRTFSIGDLSLAPQAGLKAAQIPASSSKPQQDTPRRFDGASAQHDQTNQIRSPSDTDLDDLIDQLDQSDRS